MTHKKPFLLLVAIVAVSAALLVLRTDDDSQKPLASPVSPEPMSLADSIQKANERLITSALASSDTIEPELIERAKARHAQMRQLLAADPQGALELAISYAQYAALPAELKPFFETPFTRTANVNVIAICDSDSRTPDTFISLKTIDGEYARIEAFATSRLSLSKRNLPIQGIELEGQVALRNEVFQPLNAPDFVWALENLPLANADPSADPFSGQPIGDEPAYAVAGGYLFAFADEASLAAAESQLRQADARPGLDKGSPQLFAALEQNRVNSFSLQKPFAESQSLATTETRKYLIIRADFPDMTGAPASKEELEALVNNAASPKLAEYSYNKTSVNVTVTETVIRLPQNSSSYLTMQNGNEVIDNLSLYDDALAAYINAGNADPETLYDHVSVNFPQLQNSWAGLATIGGTAQWLQGKPSAETILHELGHNYGLHHATYWVFDDANASSVDPVDPSGAEEDYGDIFDVMGDGTIDRGHFHMAAKQFLGWLEPDQWESLSSEGDSGSYRIYNFDSVSASELQALRIQKEASNGYYWVGFRKAYSGIPNFDKGAYLIWQRPGNGFANNKSKLVDTTPGSLDGKNDAGVSVGRTYSDAAAGIHLTPLSTGQTASGAYLDVHVNIGDFPGNQAPSGTLTATATGEARTPIAFSFAGNDPDGDDLAYHWDFGDGTVELNQAAVDHEFPVGGNYTLTLTVSDMKGGAFSQQAEITISDPITQVTTHNLQSGKTLNDLAANDSQVIAVGNQAVLRSEDGGTWTDLTEFSMQSTFFYDVIWTGSTFVAVGGLGTGTTSWRGDAFFSSDGVNWSRDYSTTETVGGRGFVSVAHNSDTGAYAVLASDGSIHLRDDQGNWTEHALDEAELSLSDDATILYFNGNYIVGGYDFNAGTPSESLVLRRSADGVTWEDLSAEAGFESWKGLDVLANLGGLLLGSGFSSDIRYSLDEGSTWTANQETQNYQASCFAFGNGVYLAHGTTDSNPQNFLSTDGRNWKPMGSPFEDVTYNDCIFFDNTFILVGANGIIHQSSTFEAVETNPFEAWIVGFVTDEGQQGSLANPDGDWGPNFLEYALGSNPADGSSIPNAPELAIETDGRVTVSIHRFANTDAILALEISSDLQVWAPLATDVTEDTESLLELTSTTALPQTAAIFIRIKATLP